MIHFVPKTEEVTSVAVAVFHDGSDNLFCYVPEGKKQLSAFSVKTGEGKTNAEIRETLQAALKSKNVSKRISLVQEPNYSFMMEDGSKKFLVYCFIQKVDADDFACAVQTISHRTLKMHWKSSASMYITASGVPIPKSTVKAAAMISSLERGLQQNVSSKKRKKSKTNVNETEAKAA